MQGQFIEPDHSLQECAKPHEQLGLQIFSGYQASRSAEKFAGMSHIFDTVIERIQAADMPLEDQCSLDYYFDLLRVMRDFNGEYNRVVEVGCYMGGASAIIAGCANRFDFDLDLVDVNAGYLRFSYERIRRAFPEATGRVRLFHGDLPAYVRHVMMKEEGSHSLIQHDGAHDFNQVVTDMAALSFVKDQVHAIIAQDTHLRGTLEYMNFVDLALMAVFGKDVNYMPIGAVYGEFNKVTLPNRFQGNYFLPGMPEGMVMPMSANNFQYPHAAMSFEDLFGADTGDAAQVAA